ncbi:LysE family translocator [Hydrogenophaga sp. 5NK40-0174]|uniref:LysE family translocator n=1 Tax=Hydrogenophaga sp. 5NK40-0174 TaxID=3127649 RepID=UPI003101D11D
MLSLEFLLTSLVVVLIPGTGVIYTVSQALMSGRSGGFWAAVGCTLGIVPHLLATVLGLAALLHTSALAFQLLKYAGAAYLLYMAWGTWRDRSGFVLNADAAASSVDARSVATRGALINVLNPKLSVFFLAFLPQFVPTDLAAPLLPLVTLSGVFMLMTLVVFVVYALLADLFRQHVVASERVQNWLRRSFAAAFAGLGVRLALADDHV